MLSKELIDLEIDFAVKASELESLPLSEALLKYTSLYGALFVPAPEYPKKDPQQEIWQNYLAYIKGKDLKQSTYDFYIKRTKERDRYTEKVEYSGKPCFIYNLDGENMFLHFNNNDGSAPGPLSKASIHQRLEELKNIFSDIKDKHPAVKTVNGYSWLYNIEAYTRLFPKDYLRNKIEVRDDFGFNIYGQFLDSAENVKTDMAKEFLSKVEKANTIIELRNAFRFYPIKVSAPIEIFSYD